MLPRGLVDKELEAETLNLSVREEHWESGPPFLS